jgi:hypothetical protein
MSKIIITKNLETGGVVIMQPTPECLQKYTIQEIADKDVPAGLPYKIIDDTELPVDDMFFDAWEIDESELTDGVGADRSHFIR